MAERDVQSLVYHILKSALCGFDNPQFRLQRSHQGERRANSEGAPSYVLSSL